VNKNLRHPETSNGVSLVRWLSRPLAWSVSEKAAVLILLSVGACLLAFGVAPELSNALAIAAYLALAGSLLLLAWRRFFKP
jgi:hypothetical protein